ncbi:MAG TPA: M1 family metallopeptidase [Vicinamibacterales bacterium]
MRTSSAALACALALSCLIDGGSVNGQQPRDVPGVQTFDQPSEGARSPRNASYDIDVRLDHAHRAIAGRETIRWRNISNRSTSELQFHLYWNAWRDNSSTWLLERRLAGATAPRRDDAWGSSEITAIRLKQPDNSVVDLTSHQRYVSPDDGNGADRTVLAVPLPREIAPYETVEVIVEWRAKVPRTFARTGYINDYYFIAQWFPKLGVLEDRGWNTHQFHSATEFYADYGSYDVRITAPRGFVVGASGVEAQRIDNPDDTTTHRYRAEDVHDFAWTASPRFLDVRRTFEHATLARTEMRLLLQPEHRGQEDRLFAATEATLRYYGEWFGAYPYGHITIVDPAYQSGSGGMEYPTLFTAGSRWIAPRAVTQPESVTIHEAGHQWWYGIVGSNEFEHAWMDEGLNTFSTARVIEQTFEPNYVAQRYFGGFIPWVFRDIRVSRVDNDRLTGYRDNAEADAQSTPTFRYWPGTATFVSYNKTALWLHTLERHLGWPVLQRILATYFDRWKFRHPRPDDFFHVVNEVSGRDMTWFFDQVYRSSNVFDYGVQELQSAEGGTTVVIRRYGEATFPVDVVTTFENGEKVRERWDGLERRVVYTYQRPVRAMSAQVDPERVLLLDVNYTNNSRTLEPRASEASLKWGLKWMAWLQELLLTYAFFA